MKDREESRYIRDLKKQIEKLKRENQQLRKSKRKMESLIDDSEEDDDKDFVPPVTKKTATSSDKNKGTCQKCGSDNIMVMELRKLSYYKCQDCQSKGRLTK